MIQLIYRMETLDSFPVYAHADARFTFCPGPIAAARIFSLITTRIGVFGGLKAMGKLLTPRRFYYCAHRAALALHDGWITLGLCRHYPVEPYSAVIGPVWTHPEQRRKGLATEGVQFAVNEMIRRGCGLFYIDTAENNAAMRRVIEK